MSQNSVKPSRRNIYILLSCHLFLLILFVTPAIKAGAQNWIAVSAEVESTNIKSTRPGTLAWSLMVNLAYEVDGQTYRKQNVDVFHDTERSTTETEQQKWPPGKKFTVYFSEKHPNSFSLVQDGGLEVSVVIAVLLGTSTTLVLLPFYIALKRKYREDSEDSF